MSRQTIDASLRLTAVSTSTSLNCLQWTGDGQLILVTKSAVHILTPDIGTNSEASTTKNGLDTKNGPSSPRPVGWLRTMIGFDKTLVHHWPVDCQEWGSVSLGSLDPAFRGVAPSPSSFDAGCGGPVPKYTQYREGADGALSIVVSLLCLTLIWN